MNLSTLRALLDALISANYEYEEFTPCNEDNEYLVGFEVCGEDVIFKFNKEN